MSGPSRTKFGLWLALAVAIGLGTASLHSTAQAQNPTPTSLVYLPLVARSASNSGAAPEWLAELNAMRALGNLPPVTENTVWDVGDSNHARYVVKNGAIGHTEDSSNPWYTPEGNAAASNGNVMGTTVSVTTNGSTFSWTFAVSTSPKAPSRRSTDEVR
ncbi:MAG: hypothetical protein M1482_04395 [Chloroflexi bacterium]|nr:hypothetical protein [Chloroflexota bacterium]